MKNWISIVFLLSLWGCGGSPAGGETISLEGYEVTPVEGSDILNVVRFDAGQAVAEYGQILRGKRVGNWVTMHPGTVFPAKIMTYANGMANGPYYEFNDRGQMEVRAYYKNNKLHGPWGKYRFGRPTTEANYKDGELDGTYTEFYGNSQNPQKVINYKNGQLHGKYQYYNQDGEVTLEFMYENGEKVE